MNTFPMPTLKSLFLSSFLSFLFFACSKEAIPDPIVGDWTVYSLTDSNGKITLWESLVDDLTELVPSYSCMEYTANITETLVTTNYVFIDLSSTGCIDPIIFAYIWKRTNQEDAYTFTVGNNVSSFTISFSNEEQRMTWKDNTTNEITVWDRR